MAKKLRTSRSSELNHYWVMEPVTLWRPLCEEGSGYLRHHDLQAADSQKADCQMCLKLLAELAPGDRNPTLALLKKGAWWKKAMED